MRAIGLMVAAGLAGAGSGGAEESEAAGMVKFGDTFRNVPGMRMIWVKPGNFTMGSPPGEVGRGLGEEQVEVEITKGYWLGATEVTEGQWTAVIGAQKG